MAQVSLKKELVKKDFSTLLKKDMARNWSLYIMVLPVVLFYIVFHYLPMYGAAIAFTDFKPLKGIWGSPFIGFQNFIDFFKEPDCLRVIGNTLKISVTSIVFGFPAPIIFALLINELRSRFFTKTVQTITYLPHFISLVVMCGMIRDFVSSDGIVTTISQAMGGPKGNLLQIADAFVPMYIISDIWQGIGWGSIIYLAAIAGIDQEIYEAAVIDGAGRLRQTWHITLPGLMATIITLLILRMGSVMSVGFEKIILLANPLNNSVSEVISSYIYNKSIVGGTQFGYSSAVGLFNSVINFIFVFSANYISRKFKETSLW